MKLRRVAIEGLKKFAQRREFVLGEGLNLILGRNEAGKSSFVESIVAGLFVSADTTAGAFINRIIAWGRDRGRVELELEDERLGRVMKIEKTYARDKDDTATRVELYGNGRWEELGKTKAKEVLAELVGGVDEEVYLKTACIKEHEMGGDVRGLRRGSRQIRFGEQLEEIAVGGSVQPLEAIRKLDALGRNVYTTSAISQKKEQLRQLRRELEEERERWSRRERYEKELKELEEELGRLEEELENKKELVDKLEEFAEAKKVAEDKEKDLKSIREKLQVLQNALQKCQESEYSEERLSKFKEAFEDVKKHLSVIDGLVGKISEAQREKAGTLKIVTFSIIALIFGILVLGLTGIAGVWSLALLIPLAGIAWFGIVMRRIALKIRDLESKKEEEDKAIRDTLENTGCTSLEELEGKIKELEERQKNILSLIGQVEGATGQEFQGWDEVERKVKELREKEEQAFDRWRSAVMTMEKFQKQYLVEKENFLERYNKAKREYERLEEIYEKKREDLNRLQGQLEEVSSSIREDLNGLEEEIREIEGEVKRLELRQKALTKAIEALKKARIWVLESLRVDISNNASDILKSITGRYDKVEISFGDNEWKVKAGTGDSLLDLDMLSTGTRDQVRIAARVGLSEVVFSGRKMPIILDDPFVNFDERRLKNALKLCLELGKNYQILLLTAHRFYKDILDEMGAEYHIIDLDEEGEG